MSLESHNEDSKVTATTLEKELETYRSKKADLVASSEGKFVLIFGDDVVGTFDTHADAIQEGYQKFGNVPFLAKRIEQIESPVNFANNLLGI